LRLLLLLKERGPPSVARSLTSFHIEDCGRGEHD